MWITFFKIHNHAPKIYTLKQEIKIYRRKKGEETFEFVTVKTVDGINFARRKRKLKKKNAAPKHKRRCPYCGKFKGCLEQHIESKHPNKKLSKKELKWSSEWEEYSDRVRKLTKKQNLLSIPNYGKRGDKYHLDHMISIYHGFRFGIKPEVIAGKDNLRIIPAQENVDKGSDSYINGRLYNTKQMKKENPLGLIA